MMNLYGDHGNILALEKHLKESDIKYTVDEITIGKKIDWQKYDIFFIGGGQDFEQQILSDDLKNTGNDQAIIEAINNGKVFLAICGGFQMLGKYYMTWDRKKINYTGAIDFYTIGKKERKIGNYEFKTEEAGNIVGFENHSGCTYLGEGIKPLGVIIHGNGNNGKDKTEGVHYKNAFGTYSHGPLLPKNPLFTNHVINMALKEKYGNDAPVVDFSNSYEISAHEYMEERLESGKQASSNF